MKNNFISMCAVFIFLTINFQTASAQFTIKIPKLPKAEKPKSEEQPRADENRSTETPGDTSRNQPKGTNNSNAKKVYGFVPPPATPVLLKDTIYIEARTSSTYWKMPNQKDYTSWVPGTRFSIFYGKSDDVKYTVEYYNPDGSLWFSEMLEGPNREADRSIPYQSDRTTTSRMLETKASVATGTYGVKIINQGTGETVFQGKFKVNKFLRPYSERTPNRFDFFVEHDWLLPMGYVGFHFSNFDDEENIGGYPVVVSAWLKGNVTENELEAQLFYKGQQIAILRRGSSEGRFWADRASQFAAVVDDPPIWKLWNFEWENFRFDNGGTFNRDNYPKAHYADQNSGEYTVKIFRNGTQLRELKFTVLPDGRFDDGGFSKQIFRPYHKIGVPVKVLGGAEKWNANAWKTDAFYGNPLSGFNVP